MSVSWQAERGSCGGVEWREVSFFFLRFVVRRRFLTKFVSFFAIAALSRRMESFSSLRTPSFVVDQSNPSRRSTLARKTKTLPATSPIRF